MNLLEREKNSKDHAKCQNDVDARRKKRIMKRKKKAAGAL